MKEVVPAPVDQHQEPRTEADQGHGIRQSLSRPSLGQRGGRSFLLDLKVELVHRYVWATRAQARQAIFDFIEVFYNRQRLHSTLAYRTPAEYEACLPGAVAPAA